MRSINGKKGARAGDCVYSRLVGGQLWAALPSHGLLAVLPATLLYLFVTVSAI